MAETKLRQIWLGWSLGSIPFLYCVRQPHPHSKWLLLLKIEISLVINFSFITHQNGTDILASATWKLVV